MKEKIKDTIVDLLLDGVKEKLDSVKENYKWQKLFVSTGNFFVNNPDVLVKYEEFQILILHFIISLWQQFGNKHSVG